MDVFLFIASSLVSLFLCHILMTVFSSNIHDGMATDDINFVLPNDPRCSDVSMREARSPFHLSVVHIFLLI